MVEFLAFILVSDRIKGRRKHCTEFGGKGYTLNTLFSVLQINRECLGQI